MAHSRRAFDKRRRKPSEVVSDRRPRRSAWTWAGVTVIGGSLAFGFTAWRSKPQALETPPSNQFLPTVENRRSAPGPAPDGMVWIPGGEFSMGAQVPSDPHDAVGMQAMTDSRPIHRVLVDGFWMDATEVTNEQFARFVKATETFPHMSAGWAVAFDTPFTWTKQVASDFGGTRNGMVIHWPQGIKDRGGLRSQFSHVIDIAPTILEAASLPQPKSVNGTPQTPIEGTSLVYAFNDEKAPERHKSQYFEMFGNRAIYNDGWLARTIHRAPWQTSGLQPLTSDVWDLYDVRNDFSLSRNLAAEQPAKLKEMQALFMTEAEKYHVLPIDDRTIERTNPTLAGRPDVLGDRKSLTLYEGMQGMLENTFMNIKNRSSTITAELEIPASRANGVILSQGGRFGGWSLYMKDGKPAYIYNFLGLSRYTVTAPQALPAGPATVVVDFVYDGGGAGKGGKATLSVNGKVVATGRVEKTQPNIFSADETADVGIDNQTPVAEGVGTGAETRFTGKINKITLEVR